MTKPGRQLSADDVFGKTDIERRRGRRSPCYVVVRKQSDIMLKQTIVHELYHCVQLQENPGRAGKPVLFEDSAANFFAYFLYAWRNPPSDDTGDGDAPHHYDPSLPLYDPEQRYRASLFYMYRHNRGQKVGEMDRWITAHEKNNTDMVLKRKTLAGDSALADAFANFAVKFHNKGIYYDSKELPERPFLVTTQSVESEPTTDINIPTVGSPPAEQKIDRLLSWTFRKFSVTLAPGQTISASVSWIGTPAPKVAVWRRVMSSGQPPSGWYRFKPKVLQSNCDAAGSTHEFLVVPITAEEEVNGAIRFVREKDAKCKCPGRTPPGQGPTKRSPQNEDLQARQGGNGTQEPLTTSSRRPLPPASQLGTEAPSRIPLATTTPRATEGFTTPTPDAPRRLPYDEVGGGDDSGGAWVDPGPETDIVEDSNDPAEEGNDDDLSCHEPTLSGPSCVIGRWVANKASMDAHMQDPYYYWTGSSGQKLTSVSGSYTITYEQIPGSADDHIEVTSHEKLVEVQLISDNRSGEVWGRLNSTFFADGSVGVTAGDGGFNPAGPESGYITRHVTTMKGSGSTAVTTPDGSRYSRTTRSSPTRMATGPEALNSRTLVLVPPCTITTRATFAKSYVFDRL